MHRITRIIAGTVMLWLGLSLCGTAYDTLASAAQPRPPDEPPCIDRIRELAELTVLEVNASEIVNAEISGYTGGTCVIVLVQGNVTLGVDLGAAEYLHVDLERRHLVLSLPQPTVRRTSIDPRTSRLLRCDRAGLWRMAVGPAREYEAFAAALAIGQERLRSTAASDDFVDRAGRHAESVLARFVSEMGWTLDVRWQE